MHTGWFLNYYNGLVLGLAERLRASPTRHNLKTTRSEIKIFDLRKFQNYYEANVKDAKNQIHVHFDGPNGEDRSIRQVFTIRAPRTDRDGTSV